MTRVLHCFFVGIGAAFFFATLCGVTYSGFAGSSGGLVQSESQARENTQQARCVALELYFHAGDESSKHLVEGLRTAAAGRRGVSLKLVDLDQEAEAADRYNKIAAKQKFGGISFPGIWLCQQLVVGFDGTAAGESRLSNVLQRWTFQCQIPKIGWKWSQPWRQGGTTEESMDGASSAWAVMPAARFWLATAVIASPTGQTVDPAIDRELTESEKGISQGEQPLLPLELGSEEFPELLSDDSLADSTWQIASGRCSSQRFGKWKEVIGI